jgi:hypothetical protein
MMGMGDLLSWALGGAALVLGWVACQLIAQLAGEVLWELAGPLRRRTWRLVAAVRWPWPVLLLSGIGVARSLRES